MSAAAALNCCCGGEVCFAHYDSCPGGFGQSLYVRYPTGCPGFHPPVIVNGNGSGQSSCYYFIDVHPPAACASLHVNCDPNPQVIAPNQIIATFNDCESCDPNPPPPTHGACCHGPEGTQCSDTSELECQQLNGTWFPGVDCTQVNCTTPTGACCYVDPVFGGQCVNTTSAQCALLGGTWYPPPATCANTQCQFGEGSESRGFGDTVAKFTSALGIKPCAGCKQRQATLNRLWSYGR